MWVRLLLTLSKENGLYQQNRINQRVSLSPSPKLFLRHLEAKLWSACARLHLANFLTSLVTKLGAKTKKVLTITHNASKPGRWRQLVWNVKLQQTQLLAQCPRTRRKTSTVNFETVGLGWVASNQRKQGHFLDSRLRWLWHHQGSTTCFYVDRTNV